MEFFCRMMKAALLSVALIVPANMVSATERYIGLELGSAFSSTADYGGFNTVGAFSNEDEQGVSYANFSLTYGVRDWFQLGGLPITLEGELTWNDQYSNLSDSFPGPPGPAVFFYRNTANTGRLAANFWTPIATQGNWSTEIGAGVGAQYFDLATDDLVVGGSVSEFAPYGMIGIRTMRPIGERGHLVLGFRYYGTGDVDIPLVSNGGSFPAGNLTVNESGPEIRIGFQWDM